MVPPEIMSVGNILVEVMRKELDQPLYSPASFSGPFPAGDAAIYIDTTARLGRSSGLIGAVGEDDFGRYALDRFKSDGIDLTHTRILQSYTTGVAFVAYFTDGSRKYVFHWSNSAAGQLSPEFIEAEYFRNTKWLHLTGCNITITKSAEEACIKAMNLLPPGAFVSFDANIRPELMTVDEIRRICKPVIERANVILPSLGEAKMLTGLESDEDGCRQWVSQGKLVVLKQGSRGCRIFNGDNDFEVPSFVVDEIDPTGAGDSFCAGFTVALIEGMNLVEAGRFANAVGALAVTKRGPMEGVPFRCDVEELMNLQPTFTIINK